MKRENILLLILLLIFGIFSLKIVLPYIEYVLLSIIMAIITFPIFKYLERKLGNKALGALILVISILFFIIFPISIITIEIFKQWAAFFQQFFVNLNLSDYLEAIDSKIESIFGFKINLGEGFGSFLENIGKSILPLILNNIVNFTLGVSNLIIGSFISLILLFYLYVDGESMLKTIKRVIPISEEVKEHLFGQSHEVIKAIFLGHLLTALVQGIVGMIGFVIFGIPNALFWGFIMFILSFLPILGAYLIYIPASIILILNNNVISGLLLLAYGVLIVGTIDNVVRPFLTKIKKRIHPLVVIFGVVGGIINFGLSGIILGPTILAIFLEILKIYSEKIVISE